MKGAFKMDYSNGMTVVIGNEGFYAQGELRDQAITLPVSDSELQRFLESNGLVTPMHEETYIAGAFRHSQCVRAENVKVLGC